MADLGLVRLLYAVHLANFQFECSIYLQQEGRDFDLHNDFSFIGFSYSVTDRLAELRWKRSTGDWVRAEVPAALVLTYRGMTHLSVCARDPKIPFSEDDCLSQISFVLPESPLEDAFQVSPAAPAFDTSWHWLFSFMSGFTLRLASESAELSTPKA